MESVVGDSPVKGHRRNRSAVLKSMMTSTKAIKRTNSDEKSGSPPLPLERDATMPFLPPDHPHAQRQRILREIESNHNTAQPRHPSAGEERPSKSLHKRTKSAVSLRS